MDLVEFCKRCLKGTSSAAIAMPLATIGWARTAGDPEAEGARWSGAFGVSVDLHGEAPVGLDDQIQQAAGILHTQLQLHKLDSSGLVWTPQKPIEPVLGPNGRPVPQSDSLLREIERCAALSLAWDAPADMAQAVSLQAGHDRPVTYEDLSAAMSWRHDPQPHYDAAEDVIRDGLDVWHRRTVAAAKSDTDWGKAAAGGVLVLALGYLLVRGA